MVTAMVKKTEKKVYTNKGNTAVLKEISGDNLTILDVGCGAGDNDRILVNEGHITDGITVSESEAGLCRAFMRNVFIHNLEFGLPELKSEEYDFVICSHVLEHIAYPEKVLADIKRVLKKGGRLVVALPNLMHYQSRWKLVMGRFDYKESGIWDDTHLRWYTFRSGAKLLEENGFMIIKKDVDGDVPFLRLFRFIPFLVREKLFRALSFLSKGLFGNQLIYVVKPKREV